MSARCLCVWAWAVAEAVLIYFINISLNNRSTVARDLLKNIFLKILLPPYSTRYIFS